MELNQRQKNILELVNQNQHVTVGFLAKTLFFSEMTIRRDLTKLEDGGYLKRCHGGAVTFAHAMKPPIEQRMHINEQEKRAVAKCAEKHLRDHQTIFLPGNSTCAYLLPFLKNYEGLHVITNSLQFLEILTKMQIRCTICGGTYYPMDQILIGRVAETFLRSMNYDLAFFTCDGIAEDGTVTFAREETVGLGDIILNNAKKIVLIADHSKLNQQYTYNICNLNELDDVIVM